ncbi:MAG: hypothetical protein E8D42_06890 [Nitrospira sp.]|nr:MAG: hypothetical protein E8D42_06890 [Nitrospira sp.]
MRGGSACLDSFCQFISGAWRVADYAAVCRVVRLSACRCSSMRSRLVSFIAPSIGAIILTI